MTTTITFTDDEITDLEGALALASAHSMQTAATIRDNLVFVNGDKVRLDLIERAGRFLDLRQKVVQPASAITMPIKKNGVQVGTVNFADGENTGTFTFASAVTFGPGDVLTHG